MENIAIIAQIVSSLAGAIVLIAGGDFWRAVWKVLGRDEEDIKRKLLSVLTSVAGVALAIAMIVSTFSLINRAVAVRERAEYLEQLESLPREDSGNQKWWEQTPSASPDSTEANVTP